MTNRLMVMDDNGFSFPLLHAFYVYHFLSLEMKYSHRGTIGTSIDAPSGLSLMASEIMKQAHHNYSYKRTWCISSTRRMLIMFTQMVRHCHFAISAVIWVLMSSMISIIFVGEYLMYRHNFPGFCSETTRQLTSISYSETGCLYK